MPATPFHSTRLAIVMVGLPARGKTFIARKIARYLSWLGHKTQVFNVGAYRRKRHGSRQPHPFFDPRNEAREGRASRGGHRGARRHARLPRRGRRHRHLRRDQQHARAARHGARALPGREGAGRVRRVDLRRPHDHRDEHPRDQGAVARLRGRGRGRGGARLPPAHRPLRRRLRGDLRGRGALRQDHRHRQDDGPAPHRGVPARAGRPLPLEPARHPAPRVADAARRERVQRPRPHRRGRVP